MAAIPQHLDVYYASNCTPCRIELPVLASAMDNGTEIRIRIVDGVQQAIIDLAAVDQRLARVASPAPGISPNDRLHRAGDADGILPFSQSVDRRGRICASWRGMLTVSRIRALLSRCA